MRRGLLLLLALTAGVAAAPPLARAGTVEVVVTLKPPPLARAVAESRTLTAAARARRLSLSSPTSVSHLRELDRRQDALAARIRRAIPGARVRWRYRLVLDGLAVTLPERRLRRLASLPGVAEVVRGIAYSPSRDASAGESGVAAATQASAALAGGGEGVKIAILDQGVDQLHPYFDPTGYAYPAGFPKGNTAYTTPKVIAARAFAPPGARWKYARLPFDPVNSVHGTHVAGIAAGNGGVPTNLGPKASGVAPRAYIGNYKVYSTPTASGVGLDGNSPEVAAGIEAAVRDGMDVINLSIGEPEVQPSRDLITRAVDAAVDAGVVVSIAAGNEGFALGAGSVGSPGSAAKAITVAAAATQSSIAGFSSVGPTELSLRLKPDVAAPGVDVLSSVPESDGLWARFSGTSMAAPCVSGLAALLRQQHPAWTAQQVKSALVQSAVPIPAPPTKAGSGLADAGRADQPLLFAEPTSVSFGLVGRGARATRTIVLTDAGGGQGPWHVAVDPAADASVHLAAPAEVSVPGRLVLSLRTGAHARPAAHTGFVTLSRGGTVRRVAYWLRVTARRLGRERVTILRRRGVHTGSTAGRKSLVARYRYPEWQSSYPGPEQVFRFRLRRPVANFGVVVLGQRPGVHVDPLVTVAGNEDRLLGVAALPYDSNPYRATLGRLRPVAGALLPRPGRYDVVFDTRSRRETGAFTFRFWVDDTTPPKVRLLTRTVRGGARLRLAAADPGGSGVDPASLDVSVDGKRRTARLRSGVILVGTGGLAPGSHRLSVSVADYQETKNDENVARVLPNTRTLALTFRVTS